MTCPSCGAEVSAGSQFCTSCGARCAQPEKEACGKPVYRTAEQSAGRTNLSAQQQQQYSAPQYQQTPPNYSNYSQPYNGMIPEDYKPISMWGYFGYQLLFSIPCIGFIILLVFAFGGTRNVNLKNYARSFFCSLILVAIIALIVFVTVGVTGIGSMRYYM